MKSGIYCFQNTINGKRYIGQAVDLDRRLYEHIYYLRLGKDKSVALQRAADKYGMENFDITILEYCDTLELNDKEVYYIKYFQSNNKDYGYNLSSGGNSGLLGFKHSDETRKKISEAKKGWKMSDEHKAFISKLHKGRKRSEETRMKISIANTKENHPMWGKHHSPETIQKFKDARGGEKAYQFGTKNPSASSKYYGVHKLRSKGHVYWIAELKNKGEHIHIGSSKDEDTAARMYDQYITENGLPNPLNFPDDVE